jgi:hypothetical protein
VLECVEVISLKPSPHGTVACERPHAHNDYVVRLYTSTIAFGERVHSVDEVPAVVDYMIVSEKETKKR